ncbi:MAG: endolysin [Cyanobacteriota bacterium]|nr:endolysin [Cyanobacteriota bacterium]
MNVRFWKLLRNPVALAVLVLPVNPAWSSPDARVDEPAISLPEESLTVQPSPDPAVSPFPLRVPLPAPARRIYLVTPERRALLNTIRYAEGTWANGHEIGYRIMFGGGLMPNLDRHPDRVVRRARYASAAAGAYQFMPFTWRMVTTALGLERFDPGVQDQGALFLIQRRGALALADQGLFTPHLAHRLAPEWASFPTLSGRSYYGQPVKRFDELRRFYEHNLAELRAASDAEQLAAQDSPG